MSRYPTSERVTAGALLPGHELLIRDRRSDQPYTYNVNDVGPLATGVWTVIEITAHLEAGGRRASRFYMVKLTHPSGEERTIKTSAVQRFNRVTEGR